MFCEDCNGMLRKKKVKGKFETYCPRCKDAAAFGSQPGGRSAFKTYTPENEFEDLKEWKESPSDIPYFPYETIRDGQKQFIEDVALAIEQEKTLVAYAPTGIGKTVGVLVPAIEESLKTGKKVLFLTSKQSQHKIAIETIRLIKARYGTKITAVDIVNKQDMCPRDISSEYHVVFNALCRIEQKNKTCRYHTTKVDGLSRQIRKNILHVDELKGLASSSGVCPHRAAVEAGKGSNVIICDYNYVFYSHVSATMLKLLELELKDCIIIVDEAHNLPDRIRSHNSMELTTNRIEEAMSEARRDKVLVRQLSLIRPGLGKLLDRVADGEEKLILQDDFVFIIENSIGQTLDGKTDIADLCKKLMVIGDKKLGDGNSSAAFDLSRFIEGFIMEHPSMIRVISRKDKSKIFFRLMDPSVISAKIFSDAYASILMSGTLHPTKMYADIFGLTSKDSILGNYRSPFPPENRPVYAITDVSTLYRQRSKEMYMKIARHIKTASDEVPGNIAVFFPSYNIQWEVVQAIEELGSTKELLLETRKSSKSEKESMLRHLKKLQFMGGGILLGVMAGSLSEGIDYRDNLLSSVIIVGLPLAPPSLEQTQLERYYDKKFGLGKGKEYGYTSPAMNKVLQGMGRCIRSETDRAVVMRLDLRYGDGKYRNYFPKDIIIRRPDNLKKELKEFYQG